MKTLLLLLASVTIIGSAVGQAPAAPAFEPGVRTIADLDFSTPGVLPAVVKMTQGTAAWGQQNGLTMLKASGRTRFSIFLPEPERLPQHFTIEADVFTRSNAADFEFAVQGTDGLVGTTRSALVVWHHAYAAVFRGGAAAGDKYFYPSPALLPELRNQLVRIQMVFDGSRFTYFTNDEPLVDFAMKGQPADISDLVFMRSHILFVTFGGAATPNGEVYLARLRISSNMGPDGRAIIAKKDAPTGAGSAAEPGSSSVDKKSDKPGPGDTGVSASSTDPKTGKPGAGGTGEPAPESRAPMLALKDLVVTVDPEGAATATWTAVPGASYLVMRWKIGDPDCCNAMSPPGSPLSSAIWKDGTLPGAGIYGFRVIAMTGSGMVSAETQAVWKGPSAPPPPPVGPPGGPAPPPPVRSAPGGMAPGRELTTSTTSPVPTPVLPPPGSAAVVTGVIGITLQTCAGPGTFLAPNALQALTCSITSALPAERMLVLPEMFLPGSGCVVTDDKPRVVMVGNSLGVSASFRNRCGAQSRMSEGGLGWLLVELGDNRGAPVKFSGIAGATLATCTLSNSVLLAPNATTPGTCTVASPLGANRMLVLPEMFVPGAGCVVSEAAPRVLMVGNSVGVGGTFRNRCGGNVLGSEAGIAWMVFEIGTGANQPLTLAGTPGGIAQTCAGPVTVVNPSGTVPLTCTVTASSGGNQLLVLPEMALPGNGCIVANTKPTYVLTGNTLGVSTSLQNRCGGAMSAAQGGMGWIVWQRN